MQCWSELCCQGSARSPNIDWWRMGKYMTNGELEKTMHSPKCPLNREHWDNCSKLRQVFQQFFSMIVDLELEKEAS